MQFENKVSRVSFPAAVLDSFTYRGLTWECGLHGKRVLPSVCNETVGEDDIPIPYSMKGETCLV